jgi:lysophospholipase L1-like esterase
MIYVVGDSHTAIFKNDPAFKVMEIAATANNLIREKTTANSHQKLQEIMNTMDKKCDFIMLVLGEIDCRFHIYYQAQKRETYMSRIITETVYNYGAALDWMERQGVKPIILGIPPTGTYDGFERDTPGKPYASPEILSEIYRIFNNQMKFYCNFYGYIYIDIYSKTADEKGFLKKEYAADAVHLNLNAKPLILEMLKKELAK